MSTSTRWHRLFKRLSYNHIPFSVVKTIRVTTQQNKEYHGKSYEDFSKMIEDLQQGDNTDQISSITFEPKHRKLRKLIQDDVASLIDKHFPTKKD